jgi:hypothetical protein
MREHSNSRAAFDLAAEFSQPTIQIEEFSRMRILLSSGFVLFAGMVSAPIAVAPHTQGAPPADHRQDPRFELLRSFFQKSDCPAAEYAEDFLDAADRNDLDWRLLPSLSYIESTGGKAAPNNNMFGWDSGRAQFATPGDGIQEVGYRLANSSLYKDKDIDGVLTTYNPNAEYAERVKSVMRRIGPE